MSKSIGPINVTNERGELIGRLYQNRQTKVWTAYNKVEGAPRWTSIQGTRAECRAWLESVANDPALLTVQA